MYCVALYQKRIMLSLNKQSAQRVFRENFSHVFEEYDIDQISSKSLFNNLSDSPLYDVVSNASYYIIDTVRGTFFAAPMNAEEQLFFNKVQAMVAVNDTAVKTQKNAGFYNLGDEIIFAEIKRQVEMFYCQGFVEEQLSAFSYIKMYSDIHKITALEAGTLLRKETIRIMDTLMHIEMTRLRINHAILICKTEKELSDLTPSIQNEKVYIENMKGA